ncbi:MAG: tetratricopeptide repeat protein, partial [Bdellovibrionota bacterium]
GETGRLIRISLVETEPDSSIFSGLYSIGFAGADRLEAEFYIPAQDLAVSEAGLLKITEEIRASKLKRNPFILRRSRDGQQTAEIFDTKEQAREAMKAFKTEQLVIVQNQQVKKFPSDADLSTAVLAENLLRKEAQSKALMDRARTEQLEAKRIEELKAKQAALGEAERLARRKRSTSVGLAGSKLFKEENFPGARAKFNEALTLDPENKAFYFQYGVALYKTENFNRALAMLKLADDPSVNQLERQYFIGLTHFRLREFAAAIEVFEKIVQSKDPAMSPSAQFYKGVVYFEQRDWENAQKSFQLVLDTSKDPNLDSRADNYIEQILRVRQYEEEAKRKWHLTATLGEIYDSNVLLTADSSRDTGLASDVAGYRTLFAGSVKYRSMFEETREFAAQLDVISMFTLSSDFQIADSLRDSDPVVATLTLPYTFKGLAFGKGYKGDIIPGYETTYMPIENHENKEIL